MSRLRRGRTALLCVVVVAVAGGCGRPGVFPDAGPSGSPAPSSSSATTAPERPTIVVAGRRIAAAGVDDVAAALTAAGVSVPAGRLLSVVSRRVLDPAAYPGRVLLDGRPATGAMPVTAGDVIDVVPGADRVEATTVRQVAVPLDAAAARLYLTTTPGRGEAVEGRVSRERVSLRLLRAPSVGKLRAPASLSLTLDDGPDASTSAVLALLPPRLPVVFCLIGRNARAHPALVRREAAFGARLCDHTQTHPLNLPSLSTARVDSEVDAGFASIVAASGGTAPVYFRAPGGNWSAASIAAATRLHLGLLRWSVDPRDWSRPGVERIVTSVLTQLRPGGVVLMHDGGGDRSQTVAALARLIPLLTASGWSFVLPSIVAAAPVHAAAEA